MAKFDPALLDEIRDRLPVSQVVGRTVALKRAGREFSGLSPFKAEKTPSFTVSDVKSFWHDFSSGEHGDIFAFVMRTQGMSFPEAVRSLAEEAGVSIPGDRPQTEAQREAVDRRSRLIEINEVAAAYFSRNLMSEGGAAARAYLEQRGVTEASIAGFGIGYSSAGRQSLISHLRSVGVSTGEAIDAGLVIAGDDIPQPYDRFRDRVMFPISDAKGRIIAFGGRALDKNVDAKYLNSPETPIFHKGANLYGFSAARQAIHKTGRSIVVEGYMDVVMMLQGGIAECVAPLGTAISAEQMTLLWRAAPEIVLCLDGDAAGQKAAGRALDTALPMLAPERTVRFAALPDGLDPDDLMRGQGKAAIDTLLVDAVLAVDALWAREFATMRNTSPEARAGLTKRFEQLTAQIHDQSVRNLYRKEISDRMFAAFATGSRKPAGGYSRPWGHRGKGQALTPFERLRAAQQTPSAASAALAASVSPYPRREAFLVGALVAYPELAVDEAEDVARLHMRSPVLEQMRAVIGEAVSLGKPVRSYLISHGMRAEVDHVSEVVSRMGISGQAIAAHWRESCAHQQATVRAA